MKEENDLRERTTQFALRTIRLFASLPKSTEAKILGKQLLRSGRSVSPGSAFRRDQSPGSIRGLWRLVNRASPDLRSPDSSWIGGLGLRPLSGLTPG